MSMCEYEIQVTYNTGTLVARQKAKSVLHDRLCYIDIIVSRSFLKLISVFISTTSPYSIRLCRSFELLHKAQPHSRI
jgi:hypothetical protein